MDILVPVLFTVLFVLGAGGFLLLVVGGVVARRRDHRSEQERWADEHGDEDPNKPKIFGGPSWTGTGPGL
jgi:hypothetical protein